MTKNKKGKWVDKRKKKKTLADYKARKEITGAERRDAQSAVDIKQFNRAIKHINKSLRHLKKASTCLMDVHVLKSEECKTIFKIRDELFRGSEKLQDDFDKNMGERWKED